jgi:hypothetical protein
MLVNEQVRSMLLYPIKMIRRGMKGCGKINLLHKIMEDEIVLVVFIKYHGAYIDIYLLVMSEEECRR